MARNEEMKTIAEDVCMAIKTVFIEFEKKIDKKLDDLSKIIRGKFLAVHKRFDDLDRRLERISNINELK